MNTLCVQRVKFSNIRAGGTSTFHNPLKVQASRLLDLTGVRNISNKIVKAEICT